MTLPVLRTEDGWLIGPVLIGEPEYGRLRLALERTGTTRVPGYNGAVLVWQRSGHDLEVHAQAERLLHGHCGPVWTYRHPEGALRLRTALDSAPFQALDGPQAVHAGNGWVQAGPLRLSLDLSTGLQLRQLARDLRGETSAAQIARRYGNFTLTLWGDGALIGVDEPDVLVGRRALGDALLLALDRAEDTSSCSPA